MFALVVCTSAQNQNVAFYRDVHIDDRQYQFVYKDEIPDEIIKQTNGYRIEFDSLGRISKIQYARRGTLSIDYADIREVSIVYSDSVEQRYYNYSASDTIHIVRLRSLILNKDKIPVMIKNYDADGNLTKDRDSVVQYKRILNEDGWMILCQFLDEKGQPTANYNGDYSFGYKWNNDKKFHIPETSYYNQAGELHDGKRGYAVVKSWFDKKERRQYQTQYFDANMKPALRNKRYSIARRTYYENGLVKTSTYFDTHGKPIKQRAGYWKIESQYNSFGNIATQKCYYHKNPYYKYMEYTYNYDDKQNSIGEVKKIDGKTLVVK